MQAGHKPLEGGRRGAVLHRPKKSGNTPLVPLARSAPSYCWSVGGECRRGMVKGSVSTNSKSILTDFCFIGNAFLFAAENFDEFLIAAFA